MRFVLVLAKQKACDGAVQTWFLRALHQQVYLNLFAWYALLKLSFTTLIVS